VDLETPTSIKLFLQPRGSWLLCMREHNDVTD
jgi:hypothetical protein